MISVMKNAFLVVMCLLFASCQLRFPFEEAGLRRIELAKPELYRPGKERTVEYGKYGKFEGIGTPQYKYVVTDEKGLGEAAGVGVYPAPETYIYDDPLYHQLRNEGRLEGSHWEHCNGRDPTADFFVWSTAAEPPGVKMFYQAVALERTGLYEHAVKTLYAIIVHYPDVVCMAQDGTFAWHIAPVAVDIIHDLCEKHPELELKLVDCEVQIETFGDVDAANDVIIVDPGEFVRCTEEDRAGEKVDLSALEVIERKFGPGTELVKYENNHWQLLVDGRPYMIKALTYGTTPPGQSPEDGTADDWMQMDYNDNGRIDGPYDSWVDNNRNNIQDPDEPTIGDFRLMSNMGVNTLRLYHHASNKPLLMDLWDNHGIMVMMGDFFGMYGFGSDAPGEGTDYSNSNHKEKITGSVRDMVLAFKDEPYCLLWVLGNENDYSIACNVKDNPGVYYEFANEAAGIIHDLDPTRPVALCIGSPDHIELVAKYAPEIDILMINAYWGRRGFRGLWEMAAEQLDRPVIIGEFGCPAYHDGESLEVAEVEQAHYLQGCWNDIIANAAGSKLGNALGGVVYEWMDEWWLSGKEPAVHNPDSRSSGPFPDGWGHSEYFGICGQGDGKSSPFLRDLRRSYYMLRDLWTKEEQVGPVS